MILSGQLGEWDVADLLQILRITQKTASLTVENGRRRGTLHFRDGRIVGADLPTGGDKAGPFDQAVECVYIFQTMKSGSFSITHDAVPETEESYEVREVLDAALLLSAEEDELVETGLLSARALRIAPSIESSITIAPEEWASLVALIGRFTFPELEAKIGRSAAIAVISVFRRLGVLEAAFAETGNPGSTGERPAPEPEPGVEPAIALPDAVATEERRQMRSVVSPSGTTLVPGVLSDIRERFRVAETQAGSGGPGI